MPSNGYLVTDEHRMLREAVRSLAEDRIAPRAAEIDETGEFPYDIRDLLVESDLHASHIPAAYGGVGADHIASSIVVEEIARVCASSSLIPALQGLGTTPLILGGSEELKQRYLPGAAAGDLWFSYALSEREAGSDAASMRTRAERDGDHWVLTGTKCWISGAGISNRYTVLAVTTPGVGPKGISAFVVHDDDPGFSVGTLERKLGIHGSPTAEIHFDGCRIPADRLIGEEGGGFRLAMRTLDHTRLLIGAQALGIAQGAFDVATGYVRSRQQFGQPVGQFQGIQFMVADLAMKVEAARHLVYAAGAAADSDDPSLGLVSSMAKCYASDAAMAVTTDAVQLLGGAGYTRDFPVERMMRDAKITQIYEGTNQIQRLVIGKRILG
jgi:alkylation response protein AidB-like acyl-CoA dehydrogenase